MTIKIDSNTSAVAYHVKDGATNFPYAIDAHSAVSRFPKEWSFTPWLPDGERSAPALEIPDGWQDLRPIERINLAAALGEPRKGLTAAKADEAIQAEVERREAEPEAPATTVQSIAPAKPSTANTQSAGDTKSAEVGK